MNDIGKEQAEISGKYLNEYRQLDKKFDQVLSSPLIRAKETAEIVCKIIGYDIDKIIYMDELKEVDAGLVSIGKTNDEMRKDPFYDKYFELEDKGMKLKDPIQGTINFWLDEEELAKFYEIETYEHLKRRFKKVFDFIERSNKSKILIISHGGAITNGVGSFFNIRSLKGDYKYGSNCHITYIVYHDSKKFAGPKGTRASLELMYGPSTAHFKIYGKDYSTSH